MVRKKITTMPIKRPLNIIFMGTPGFAATTLKALVAGPDEVVLVVTQPDRAKGRGKKMSPSATKLFALSAGIAVLQPTTINTEDFANNLLGYDPDLIVVAAYGQIFQKTLIELVPLGCINVHGSLLPRYRGAAPVQWSVIRGEKEVGVTVIQVDTGIDTGDILLKATLKAKPDETAGSLSEKLAKYGGKTLLAAIKGLKDGSIQPIPQDHRMATEAPMLKKADGLINWQKDASEIDHLIRGLDPWPAAFSFLDEKRLRLFSPEVVYRDSEVKPGTVLHADRRGLLVACGNNALLIKEIQQEGKKRMPVEAFICGYKFTVGAQLRPKL